MRTSRWLGVLGALWVSGSALAHHGWSGYDSERPMTLTGVIRESRYENPHGSIVLEGEVELVTDEHRPIAERVRTANATKYPQYFSEGAASCPSGRCDG